MTFVKMKCTAQHTRLVVHKCILCYYPCGFFYSETNLLYFDAGCYCGSNLTAPRRTTEQELRILFQTHPKRAVQVINGQPTFML